MPAVEGNSEVIDIEIGIDMKIDIDTYLPTYLCWSTPPWRVIGWPE